MSKSSAASLAFDAHGPWRVAGRRVLRGLILLHAKLVEVVVVSDVFEAGQLLAVVVSGSSRSEVLCGCAVIRGETPRPALDAQRCYAVMRLYQEARRFM